MRSNRYIYTVGYEGLSIQAFIARLKDVRIHTLIDAEARRVIESLRAIGGRPSSAARA